MSARFVLVLFVLSISHIYAGSFDKDSLTTKTILQPVVKADLWIARDKALHLVGSFIMTGVSAKSLHHFGELKRKKSAYIGFSVSFSIGIAKEIYDQTKAKNSFSYKDLTADLMGCIIGYFVFK